MTKADLLENQVQPNMIIPFGRSKVFFKKNIIYIYIVSYIPETTK